MQRRTATPALAALVLILGACASQRAWTTADPWYREPPVSWYQKAQPLDAKHVVLVSAQHQFAAQAMLVRRPVTPLSTTEAASLTGTTGQPEPGLTFYLVRAVYLNEATGGFGVSRNGTEILVVHTSLGRNAVPMKRAALVAQLSAAPSQVHVTCHMAE